jgi:fructokinase
MSPPSRPGLPLVVVGEALVDIVVPHGARGPDSAEVTEAVGGSPLNVAVGLARLDVPAVLLTRIGDDERGGRVVEHVRVSGAELAPGSVVPGLRTSTATARLDESNAATYDFDIAWELPAQELPPAQALHLGSLGASLPPGRTAVAGLARQAVERGILVSYDPNMRPALMGDREQTWADVRELAALSTLVKMSDEDAEVLRPGLPLRHLADELLAAGRTALVVVTRGGAGAVAFGPDGTTEVPLPHPVSVVDTVGAGDSFMAAALASLVWRGVADAEALRAFGDRERASLLLDAMTAAAVTVARRGANPPTRRELPPTWPGMSPQEPAGTPTA